MEQRVRLGLGAVLMAVGSGALFAPFFVDGLPDLTVGAGVMILAFGTLLVGISGIREGEHTV